MLAEQFLKRREVRGKAETMKRWKEWFDKLPEDIKRQLSKMLHPHLPKIPESLKSLLADKAAVIATAASSC